MEGCPAGFLRSWEAESEGVVWGEEWLFFAASEELL
jgi:hypothetical protein